MNSWVGPITRDRSFRKDWERSFLLSKFPDDHSVVRSDLPIFVQKRLRGGRTIHLTMVKIETALAGLIKMVTILLEPFLAHRCPILHQVHGQWLYKFTSLRCSELLKGHVEYLCRSSEILVLYTSFVSFAVLLPFQNRCCVSENSKHNVAAYQLAGTIEILTFR